MFLEMFDGAVLRNEFSGLQLFALLELGEGVDLDASVHQYEVVQTHLLRQVDALVVQRMVHLRHALQHAVLQLLLRRPVALQLLPRDLLVQHPLVGLLHEDDPLGESAALHEDLVELEKGREFLVVDLPLEPQQRLMVVDLVLVVLVDLQSD